MCDTARMGKRQESRERIEAQIIEVGRRHLATDGAAGLSLRAIARELGMVSSAVYRYVASRDELLTLLLVDAYTDLADTVDRAAADGSWRDRLLDAARATRRWAVTQPARWTLLYGSPVPGYHAPPERTVAPGTRVVQTLFDCIADASQAGAVVAIEGPAPQPLSGDYDRLRAEFGFPGADDLVTRCTALWAALVGAVSLEVFGQYGADTFTDPAELFDAQFETLLTALFEP